MSEVSGFKESLATKSKRSRNGCNECRRLHRRCDEEKPACKNCQDSGKDCSYKKSLSWGGRPFRKGPFKHVLDGGIGQISTGSDVAPSSRSFVYGQVYAPERTCRKPPSLNLESRSKSVSSIPTIEQDSTPPISLAEGSALTSAWIPWLSQHHRTLFHHFTMTTIQLFDDSLAVQQEIRSTIVPMAVDTNHGFSLLAAILSLASTHRKNLGLHRDNTEIEYWRDMSVGHLRRPTVQEDGNTENVFAATALMLCIRDVISDYERPFSWKLHLRGAFTVLKKTGNCVSPVAHHTRRVLLSLGKSIQLRSMLPSPSAFPSPVSHENATPNDNMEAYGFSPELVAILLDIRALRQEKAALQNIEAKSSTSNMTPLWSAVRGRCLDNIVAIRKWTDENSSKAEGSNTLHRLYAHVMLLQIYCEVLDLPITDSGVKSTLESTLAILRSMKVDQSGDISVGLVFPIFVAGYLVQAPVDRKLIRTSLIRVAKGHGKANATLAKKLLEEIWVEADGRCKPARQADIDPLSMQKGWDLPLW